MIGNWDTTYRYVDFKIMFIAFFAMIDIYHYSKVVDCFIGDIFHKPFVVIDPRDFAIIVHTNEYLPALGIGEATYPFKVVIPLGLFIFYVLGFGHDIVLVDRTNICVFGK